MASKLRIGLLLDSFKVPLWEYIIIEKILASNYANIELVILKENAKQKKTFLKRFLANRNRVLYKIYSILDQKLFKVQPNAFELRDSSELLNTVEFIFVKPNSTKFSDRFEEVDIAKIKEKKVDVLIRFGFNILRGEILKCSKYGVWSYHHGDNNIIRGGPAGFWEVMENWPVTGSILQILTEDLDAGKVLYRSYSKTDERSVYQNKNSFYWKSASFLTRKLEELHKIGGPAFQKKVDDQNKDLKFYSNRLFSARTISNWKMLKMISTHIFRYLKDKYDHFLYIDQWVLVYKTQKKLSTAFWNFIKIVPPKEKFYADPFFISNDNKYYIFIEEYIYKDNKGHISVIEMDSKNNHKDPVKILDRSYHLSYPFIAKKDSDYYLIPETRASKSIQLYKCIEFPFKWEFQMNLMENVEAVDATLFYYKNKWWLFTNMVENEGASSLDELFLFYSEILETSQWTAHPLNPIISDVRKSRPAGGIYMYQDKIIRPSQNCSKGYGYGLKMNHITILNENEYKEIEINSIEPNWEKNLKGTHTFNTDHNLTMIDAKLRRRRFF